MSEFMEPFEPSQESQLKLLIARGKEQGYLTYGEVNDHLPPDIADPEQIEDIIQMINDMGISVFETAPDADTLMMSEDTTDEDAAEAAAAALASVESEIGRTTDPVRMYMREMGTVELLTREGEINIAKRIEEGIRQVLHTLSTFPRAIGVILDEYEKVEAGELRLSDLISGFVSEDDDDEMPFPAASHVGSELSEADLEDEDLDTVEEEVDTGPDPEEARARFTELRSHFESCLTAINTKGRESREATAAMTLDRKSVV